MFNFEKLEVWQKAVEFADLVYSQTRDFPADERFGLTNQMRRASVSISSNIAEGSSRISKKDFARFIEIACGSVFEVVSQSFIGRNQGFLSPEQFETLYRSRARCSADSASPCLKKSERPCDTMSILANQRIRPQVTNSRHLMNIQTKDAFVKTVHSDSVHQPSTLNHQPAYA